MSIYPAIAGADLSAGRHLFVKSDGTDSERVILATASTDAQTLGVLQNAPADEGLAQVKVSGLTKVRAGGALEPHDFVMWGTGGKAVKYVAGSGNVCLGRYIPAVIDTNGSLTYVDSAATDLIDIDLDQRSAEPTGRIIVQEATIDFGAVADEGTTESGNITVTGAAVGDACFITCAATVLAAGVVLDARVTAANTVVASVRCFKAAGVDLASLVYYITVIKA